MQLLLEEDEQAMKSAKPKGKGAIMAAAKKLKRMNGDDSDDSDDFKPAAKKKAAPRAKVEKKPSPIKAVKASPAKRPRSVCCFLSKC
jgi:DNA topoisomerase-2